MTQSEPDRCLWTGIDTDNAIEITIQTYGALWELTKTGVKKTIASGQKFSKD